MFCHKFINKKNRLRRSCILQNTSQKNQVVSSFLSLILVAYGQLHLAGKCENNTMRKKMLTFSLQYIVIIVCCILISTVIPVNFLLNLIDKSNDILDMPI